MMTTVRAVTTETPGVQTYDLTFDDAAVTYSFLPGQFNMLYLPGVGESALSVSSDPGDSTKLRHTVRVVGNVTRAMARLRSGDKLGVRGPFGTAWPVDDVRGKDVIVAAGGLGLAPLRPAIYHFIRHRSDYGRVTVLYGARTPEDLLFANEYDVWCAAGLDVQSTVDIGTHDWHGSIGFVTTLLARLTLDPARTTVFTCGPEVMMRFIAAGAVGRGVSASQVFVSLERNMNCAVGLCGHCQFGPTFVCKDGPVVTFDRVRQLLLVENF
ncbi:MAG: FAD/NAD(P)-binding protein [Planctomycetes bacterium]|nr:FAD/NAD(P)-binding protein [Planctomycetota bacterium]